ncbi:MAG: hypothetical protein MJ126_00045 [Lachnospiraceae bacterium]|nr:hypothetical protein [Lachnospiraceae bacterium]
MAAPSDEEKRLKEEKKKIQDERKKFKEEQKKAQKEAKAKAKELSKRETDLYDENSGSSVFMAILVTIVLVLVWIAIICLVIKLDLGGLGTTVSPFIKNVPVINKILPKDLVTETEDVESYYGYTSLSDAVDRIKLLETELAKEAAENEVNKEQIDALTTEVNRLKTFETNQVEFERIKNQFYEEVVYSEKGPGADAYAKFFEAMDPDTAEYLYRQVAKEENVDAQVSEYAKAYAEMKPAQAAKIFENMTDNLSLAAKILDAMSADDRGKILGAMDPSVAAKITKIMEP